MVDHPNVMTHAAVAKPHPEVPIPLHEQVIIYLFVDDMQWVEQLLQPAEAEMAEL